jgi:hypothetical protein
VAALNWLAEDIIERWQLRQPVLILVLTDPSDYQI